MLINGSETHFLLTVGTTRKIARLCPEGDIANIGLIFEGQSTDKIIDVIAELAVAMSEGYETRQKYSDPNYAGRPLEKDEVMCMTMEELESLQMELMGEIGEGMKTEVEAEPEKSKWKKNEKVTA
jgi:putative AlgH/UPF0301 family transcriptional regulator